MDTKFSIRTMLLATFLLVAFLTPIFAYASYDMVQSTGEQSEEIIKNTIEIADLSQKSVHKSQEIVNNFENIRDYQQESNQAAAEEEGELLADNFREFVNVTNQLVVHMNESEEDFSEEKQAIAQTQNEMETLVQYTLSAVRTGSTVSGFVIDDSRDQLDRVSETSTSVSTRVVSSETQQLIQLNENLRSLSGAILLAGGTTVLLGLAFALGLSVLISRPIRKLETEAEKIEREEFEEVDLERIDTRIEEFDEFKEMVEDVVIALKSEFDRDRKGMNDLALELVDLLSEEVPRGVAESSVSSAAEKAGVSPVDMTEDDLEEVIRDLEVSTRGLGVSEDTFEKMRDELK